jgi:hypothetical protein
MDDETWMTAQEALDYGFVDQLDTEMEVENSLKDGMLIMNSVSCDLSRFQRGKEVEAIINGFSVNKAPKSPKNAEIGKESEENPMDNKDLFEKLKNLISATDSAKPEPAPADADAKDPVIAERERIMALDALDDHSNGVVTKLVNAAKANGSTVEQVKPFIDAIREENEQKANQEQVIDAIKALISDQVNSGASAVAPSAPPATDEDAKKRAIDEIVNIANKKRG